MSSSSAAIPASLRQRRFARLNPEQEDNWGASVLKGIIFNIDGTLCLLQHHMFTEMRTALGIDNKVDIIHHIRGLPAPEARLSAADKIKAVERNAIRTQQPQPGLVELMDYLQAGGLPRGLCTRNFEMPVLHLLKTHLPMHTFLPIITRETPDLLPMPDSAGILYIVRV